MRSHHGRVTDRLPSINGFAIRLPAHEARALRRNRQVLNLTLNTHVHGTGVDAGSLATTYPKTIGADKLWAAGITGKGVGVAVVDSGINGDMPDFKNADGSSRVDGQRRRQPGHDAPRRRRRPRHAVAGIIAGNSFNRDAGDPAHGAYVGVAPEANLVAVKTADDAGDSTVLDVITALQFVVDHKDDLNIRVVNLSVSSDTPGSYRDDPLDAAVEFAWHAGIVVVAAAGNRGDAADAVDYAPGNDPYVISVGATDEAGTVDPATTRSRRSRAAAHAGRRQQAGSARPGRPHRRAAGHGQRLPGAVPAVRRRRGLPAHGRHVDVRPGRRRRRGAPAAGPPRAQPRRGQGAAHREHRRDRAAAHVSARLTASRSSRARR